MKTYVFWLFCYTLYQIANINFYFRLSKNKDSCFLWELDWFSFTSWTTWSRHVCFSLENFLYQVCAWIMIDFYSSLVKRRNWKAAATTRPYGCFLRILKRLNSVVQIFVFAELTMELTLLRYCRSTKIQLLRRITCHHLWLLCLSWMRVSTHRKT